MFLLNLIRTSLYSSSKPTNPSTLFGGTWKQITDCFILAAGEIGKDGAKKADVTGGSATHKLTVDEMPSHSHSFTPKGTVSKHSHSLNSGNTSTTGTGKTAGFRGSSVTTGDMSQNATSTFETEIQSPGTTTGGFSYKDLGGAGKHGHDAGYYHSHIRLTLNVAHTHSVTAVGYLYGNTDLATPAFYGEKSSTETAGEGTEFLIMPPYITKYVWERTA